MSLHELSDDELLTLAQQRDQDAFAELMRRSSSTSFKLALAILKDRQDAEDEVQNSYWKAWRYLGQFQRDSKFSTWMSRIVINHCLMRLRKLRQATLHPLDIELPDHQPTPEASLKSTELSAVLRTEIRRLPPLLRDVLVMRDLEELPIDDVAGRLGITVMAAKMRLLRARRELRHRLERHGLRELLLQG